MRVAIVDGDVSYPATSGKRLRTLNLMLRLAPRHQIVYIGRCAPGSEEQKLAPDFLRSHGIEPVIVADPVPKKSGLAFYARLARNLLSSSPYSVTSHQSQAMRDAVNRVAREQNIDLWQFEWTPYLDALDPAIAAPRLVMAHNVDTLIWQRYYENETRFLHRRFLKTQWRRFEAFEKRAFARADRVVAVSEEDATLIRTQFGQPATDVVDNGIDREFFASVQGPHDPHTILFLGALDWRPNLDAVELLLSKIFPEVRRQEPNAKLVIVGRNPPAALATRIAATPGVELHANVPDVRPFLGQAGVMTVPLRIGGGSRLKILEALASGLPVVSTKVGAEGLNLIPGEHFVEADEHAMAAALVEAMRCPDRMRQQAEVARRLVAAQYDWGVLAEKLEASWNRCLHPLPLCSPLAPREDSGSAPSDGMANSRNPLAEREGYIEAPASKAGAA